MKRVELSTQQKNWIRKRDNETCQLCKQVKGGTLHVHHIVAFSYAYFLGWSIKRINAPTNLILLCIQCHGEVHSQDRWDMETENKLAEIAIENTLKWKRRR